MGVWLGWHICYNATQVSQGQLRENRNLSSSIRAKAVLIYVLSVPVHNGTSTCLLFAGLLVNGGSSCVKARPSDPLVYVWILWFLVASDAARLAHKLLFCADCIRFSASPRQNLLQSVLLSRFSTALAIVFLARLLVFFCGYRCQKSYHRDNWLVAAERSKRCRFLILRCRLFLSCARIRAQG